MAKQSVLDKLTIGRKLLILFLLMILIAVAYYFVVHRDKSKELEQAKQNYQRLVQEEKDWLDRKQNYMKDVEELNRKKERQREQVRILPPDAEMSSFLNDLDNLAGLAGLDIKLIEPKSEQGAGFYAKIPVKLVLDGRFHQTTKFFFSVSKLERVINIENIEFKSVVVDENDVTIGTQVMATTFRSLEKPGSGPGKGG
jgi:type IV pilus assembly protein PilO